MERWRLHRAQDPTPRRPKRRSRRSPTRPDRRLLCPTCNRSPQVVASSFREQAIPLPNQRGRAHSSSSTPATQRECRPACQRAACIGDRRQHCHHISRACERCQYPFTVKDSKGKLVAVLTERDIRIYENNVQQRHHPLHHGCHPALGGHCGRSDLESRLHGAGQRRSWLASGRVCWLRRGRRLQFNNGPQMLPDFTGAQSARLTQAIDIAKGSGRDQILAGSLSGPLSQTTVINNQNFDPIFGAERPLGNSTERAKGHSTP